MKPNFEDEIVIGIVAKSFGIKGFLKIIPLTDFPERFKNLEKVHLYSEIKKAFFENKGEFDLDVEESGVSNDSIRLKIKGIDDRNQSDLLRNYLVTIPISERIERNENEHYYYELIDCDVFDEKGRLVGKVKVVENFGGDDLLKVEVAGSLNEAYIPYRDEFIVSVDKNKKRIDAKLIEGLID